MEMEKLGQLIQEHSDDSLSKKDGMVYQVWSDGEITLQKSGSLLWQRNLHSIFPGTSEKIEEVVKLFPHSYNGYGYIFTTEFGARLIAEQIAPVDSTQYKMLQIGKERAHQQREPNFPELIEEINQRNTIGLNG